MDDVIRSMLMLHPITDVSDVETRYHRQLDDLVDIVRRLVLAWNPKGFAPTGEQELLREARAMIARYDAKATAAP